MNSKTPKVSIGLPVFNGENYLEATLESISTQTFADFELIVSDNASTDRTQSICQAWAARDDRIRYYRNDRNLGAAFNYNRTFELSRGGYFKWAAHDDLLAPNFLECCVSALDAAPEAVLAFAPSTFIDEDGSVLARHQRGYDIASAAPGQRFWRLVTQMSYCFPIFGLIRSSTLGQTALIGAFPHSDRVTLLELSLLGPFTEATETMFYLRQHTQTSLRANPSGPALRRWFDPSSDASTRHPFFRLTAEKFRIVNQSSIGIPDKTVCHVRVVGFALGWIVPAAVRKVVAVLAATQRRSRVHPET